MGEKKLGGRKSEPNLKQCGAKKTRSIFRRYLNLPYFHWTPWVKDKKIKDIITVSQILWWFLENSNTKISVRIFNGGIICQVIDWLEVKEVHIPVRMFIYRYGRYILYLKKGHLHAPSRSSNISRLSHKVLFFLFPLLESWYSRNNLSSHAYEVHKR